MYRLDLYARMIGLNWKESLTLNYGRVRLQAGALDILVSQEHTREEVEEFIKKAQEKARII